MEWPVLWIDDEWKALPEQITSLEGAAMKVECAASVQEGLRMLSNQTYRGILLDMILPWKAEPNGDVPDAILNRPFLGLEVIEQMAKLPPAERPRIVVLTVARDERLLRKLNKWKKEGLVSEVLTKGFPLTFGDVTDAFADAMGLDGATDASRGDAK